MEAALSFVYGCNMDGSNVRWWERTWEKSAMTSFLSAAMEVGESGGPGCMQGGIPERTELKGSS